MEKIWDQNFVILFFSKYLEIGRKFSKKVITLDQLAMRTDHFMVLSVSWIPPGSQNMKSNDFWQLDMFFRQTRPSKNRQKQAKTTWLCKILFSTTAHWGSHLFFRSSTPEYKLQFETKPTEIGAGIVEFWVPQKLNFCWEKAKFHYFCWVSKTPITFFPHQLETCGFHH